MKPQIIGMSRDTIIASALCHLSTVPNVRLGTQLRSYWYYIVTSVKIFSLLI